MKKPIIIQILPRLTTGGVERTTVDMAGYLASLDDVPTYVVSAGGPLVAELKKSGCNHIPLPVQSKNPITILLNSLRLARLAKDTNAQLLHVHSRAPGWSVLLASKFTGIPYISTYHGAYKNKGYPSNWYNSTMARGSRVIAISEYIAKIIKRDHGHCFPKIIKIPLGIDTHVFDPERYSIADTQAQKKAWGIPPDSSVLLAIGRITVGKRYDMVIKALSQLKNQKIHLVIVGSDYGHHEVTRSLKDLALFEGVRDHVHFCNDCKDIPLAYATSDIVLFPTELPETFGRISAEAGAMGKIVIASNGGAIPEVIADGKTGYLFSVGDLDSLVERLQSVLEMPEDDRKQIEQQARDHIIKNFSADVMFSKTLQVYEDVIGENHE